jgi:hypothetical protein
MQQMVLVVVGVLVCVWVVGTTVLAGSVTVPADWVVGWVTTGVVGVVCGVSAGWMASCAFCWLGWLSGVVGSI